MTQHRMLKPVLAAIALAAVFTAAYHVGRNDGLLAGTAAPEDEDAIEIEIDTGTASVAAALRRQTVLDVIHSRKSVRHFIPHRPVSRDDLETLVRAGMAAPTAMNRQPWAFVAVTDRAVLDELRKAHPSAKFLKDASAVITVCGDRTRMPEKNPDFWIQDTSAASENILLAAEAMGLGAVWCGVYPTSREAGVRQALKLPDTLIPLNMIVIGHPVAGEDLPKDKWNPDRLHWQTWHPRD